ncbi:phage baseplate assembly protein V [Pseudanabaena sp. FACHB-2040]|uniref:phage baseplate assembly protein V n=1 Tax=Pseudanabaena sp. FACHB-2040 TaxID=2692859 RepID=UPI00168781D1|nr:phage baseplate assembly protein V [Pseudanabaena sp. FACHB-2040]MBD2256645.1 hypothetical protein [Pseudanabaena sp. FACHB-2040]
MSTPLDEIFSLLHQSQRANQLALDQEGRAVYPYLAIVSDNNDPQNRRRIKCVSPHSPGIQTDWLRRLQSASGFDPPLPAVGQTVIVFSIDGAELNGWYLQVVNDTNPPLPKSSAQDDLYSQVPGRQDERTEGDRIVRVGKSLTFQNDAGASITLAANGNVVIQDAAGNSMNLAGGIAFSTSSLSVAGKQIATVGSVDSDGDTTISRGW